MITAPADQPPAGLLIADGEGNVIHVNDVWMKLTGQTGAEAAGSGWLAAIHADDREATRGRWTDAAGGGRTGRGSARVTGPDGVVAACEWHGQPLDPPLAGAAYLTTWVVSAKSTVSLPSPRLYEALLSTVPDLAYVWDKQYRFIYANQALLTMWGKTWDEAIGKRCGDLGYADWHAAMHEREIDTVIATKQQVHGEVFFDGTNGNRLYDYILSPILDAEGNVEAVGGTTRDVTERKVAEDRAHFLSELAGKLMPLTREEDILAETVAMMGQFLKVQRCYFVECLKAENFVTVSKNWLRDEGIPSLEGTYPLDAFGGEEWWQRYSQGGLAITDVSADPLTVAREQAYLRLGVRAFATRPIKRMGNWVALLAVAEEVPRQWTGEEISLLDHVMARVWPLVEQARSVEAIRRSRGRLAVIAQAGRTILDAETPDEMLAMISETAAVELDADITLTVLAGEGAAPPRVGYSAGLPDELAERIARGYFGGEEDATDDDGGDAAADERARELLADENVLAYASWPLSTGDERSGVMIFASRRRGSFSDEERGFLRTISQHVTAAYVRLRLLANLRESDRRKDQFLATLAHELRNPLAPVLTGLEIMRQSNGKPEILERVTGIIERQTRQMAHLIDELMDISRVNTGKIVIRKEIVSFAGILRNAVEASQPLFEERRHTLVTRLPLDPLMVEVDRARISQVVSNLLSNAAKYTADGGMIVLEAGAAGDGAWARVTDNGQGIETADQQAIFDLFHQTKDGSADGLGIGLTLVRSLMEMHGGSVTVRSEGRGRGSEFEIHLPGAVVSGATDDGEAAAPAEVPAAKRALIVDDAKYAADMLAMFLKLEGMEVAVSYNGLEGLEKARVFRPDFVIMDIGMPVMDGLEAAARMRREQLGGVMIALSGWGREEDKRRTAESGFDFHLTKPVTPAEIRKVIAEGGRDGF